MKTSIYLSGSVPKGKKAKADFVDWRPDFINTTNHLATKLGIDKVVFLNPNTADYDMMPVSKFFGRDVHMVKLSEGIVVDGRKKIGIGIAHEMLIASYYGHPVITVCPPNSHYKKVIETDKGDTLYLHPFVSETSDVIVDSFDDAAKAFLEHISGKNPISVKGIDKIESARKDYEKNFMHLDKYMVKSEEELNH